MESLFERARLLAHAMAFPSENVTDIGSVQRIVSSMSAEQDVLQAVIFDLSTRKILASSQQSILGATVEEAGLTEMVQLLLGAEGRLDRERQHLKADRELWGLAPVRLSLRTVNQRSPQEAALLLRIDAKPSIVAAHRSAVQRSLTLLLVIVAITATVLYLLKRIVVLPIEDIAYYLKYKARDHGSTSAPIRSFDEIGDLAESFNALLNDVRSSTQKLKEQQAELEQTMRAISEAAIVAVMDKKGRCISANENLCEISGYQAQELMGRSLLEISSTHRREEFFEEMWQSILAGQIWKGEIQYKAKNGSYYWTQTVIAPIRDLEGEVQRLISLQFDLTMQKATQEKLVHSAKMSSLGEMAGGIAHEINNPLAIICGKVTQMKKGFEAGRFEPRKFFEDLSKLESTAQRIAKIIRGLRSFSRDSGHDPMVASPFSRILEDTLELCSERFKHHGIELRINCKEDLILPCRPSQISQILMNLLSNSFDAVENLPEKWVELNAMRSANMIKIVVEDSGSGIDSDTLRRMMQPFFTTKQLGKGTGLGLSISKGIAEEHQGELFVDVTRAHTCFILKLPLLKESA